MVFEGLDGILLAQLEGNDEIRPQLPGELPRHHGGVSAVGTGGGRRVFVADKLRAATGTAVGPHTVALRGRRVLSGIRLLCRLLGCRRFFLLLCVKRLNFRYLITGAAVFTLQLSGRSHEMERARTSRTLIICDLCWHVNASFPYRSRPGTAQNPQQFTRPSFQ